jgi:hypothetical protein
MPIAAMIPDKAQLVHLMNGCKFFFIIQIILTLKLCESYKTSAARKHLYNNDAAAPQTLHSQAGAYQQFKLPANEKTPRNAHASQLFPPSLQSAHGARFLFPTISARTFPIFFLMTSSQNCAPSSGTQMAVSQLAEPPRASRFHRPQARFAPLRINE